MLKPIVVVVLLLEGARLFAGEPMSAKVWKGSEGQLVDVATLAPAGNNHGTEPHALVRVRQSGTELDGLVLDCSVEDDGHRRTYITRHLGQRYELLRLEDGRGTVYLASGSTVTLKFSEDISGKPASDQLVSERAQQLSSGAIALFEKKAFPHLVSKYEDKANEAAAEVGGACGATVQSSFAWASFPDDVMENVDVWSLCQPFYAQSKSHCAAIKGVIALVCKLGPSFSLDRVGATLTFTTTRQGASTAGAFVSSHLRK